MLTPRKSPRSVLGVIWLPALMILLTPIWFVRLTADAGPADRAQQAGHARPAAGEAGQVERSVVMVASSAAARLAAVVNGVLTRRADDDTSGRNWGGRNWGGRNWGGGDWQGSTWDGAPETRDYGQPTDGALWFGA